MKKLVLYGAVAAATAMLSQTAQADRVKGGARADFANDELLVPCVLIDGYDEAADGQFFDIVLKRRGRSFNYDLTFAEPEEAAVCEELANYAIFIDDDPVEGDGEDEEGDGEGPGGRPDGVPGFDVDKVADMFARCEVRVDAETEEQTRSKIKVKGKELEPGDYYAVVSSSENSLQSETRTIEDDEVEIEFSSDADDVLEGYEAIEATFIQDDSVTAELFDAATDEVVMSETVSCLVR